MRTKAEGFQRGDLVGGEESIDCDLRCYYWRDEMGAWHPFPDAPGDLNDQTIRTDAEIEKYLSIGQLVRYPRKVHA